MMSNRNTTITLNHRPVDLIDDIKNIKTLFAELLCHDNPAEVMGTDTGVKSAGKLMLLLNDLEDQTRNQI
ncbi:hypothetical protein [Thiomicrorhabdus cannonii]|uniref:hypothetical protein n=1 Tax=Thiomicrorhabdus cannonii TaxID=2748011 RepID=UPI0015BBDB30|nr:hypothetical protein [Thiomicrorhabdus cannonii]